MKSLILRKVTGFVLIVLSIAIVFIAIFSDGFESWRIIGPCILATLMFLQGRAYITEEHNSQKAIAVADEKSSSDRDCDDEKRKALIGKLKQMKNEPIISFRDFFDGNFNDLGSIGCNLYPEHPGISKFLETFEKLESREDVESIYVHISEIDPGDEYWPYTDRVYVFGSIPIDELKRETKLIEPTEIGKNRKLIPSIDKSIDKSIEGISNQPLNILWWD